jgi:hypothetical protein
LRSFKFCEVHVLVSYVMWLHHRATKSDNTEKWNISISRRTVCARYTPGVGGVAGGHEVTLPPQGVGPPGLPATRFSQFCYLLGTDTLLFIS